MIRTLLDSIFEEIYASLEADRLNLSLFAAYEARLEGWLQALMLVRIKGMELRGDHIQVEAINKQTSGLKKPDFTLILDGQRHYLEVKTYYERRGFGSTIKNDLPKLKSWGPQGSLMILAYGMTSRWPDLSAKLQEGGLTCLKWQPIGAPSVDGLSLWQYH